VNAVAIVATIGGAVVGVAGIVGNCYIAWLGRRQALELAEKSHSHERDLARGDRLYARRAPVYEEMIASVHGLMEHVELTEPIVVYSGDPEPPPRPALEDQRAMQAKLRTHGSRAVADALDEFLKDVRTFEIQVRTFRIVRDQQNDITDVVTKMNDARERAREAMRSIERLVSSELESL
jgi:hypothetical protein